MKQAIVVTCIKHKCMWQNRMWHHRTPQRRWIPDANTTHPTPQPQGGRGGDTIPPRGGGSCLAYRTHHPPGGGGGRADCNHIYIDIQESSGRTVHGLDSTRKPDVTEGIKTKRTDLSRSFQGGTHFAEFNRCCVLHQLLGLGITYFVAASNQNVHQILWIHRTT